MLGEQRNLPLQQVNIIPKSDCHCQSLQLFPRAPSITYAVAMQDRLEALEKTMQRLKNATELERSKLLEDYFRGDIANCETINRSNRYALHVNEGNPQTCAAVDDEIADILDETTVTKNGQLDFFGPTSHYHVLQEKNVQAVRQISVSKKTDIVHNSLTIRGMPIGVCAPATHPRGDLRSALSPEISELLVNELLDVYWCWPHHFHLVLCRNLFMS